MSADMSLQRCDTLDTRHSTQRRHSVLSTLVKPHLCALCPRPLHAKQAQRAGNQGRRGDG
eukprot:816874-Pyramimonas_sp.AAC.1